MTVTARSTTRRILMLAPEPVLQPRGTPISVFHRLRALSALGYSIDLVTYPLGEPINIPNVRVLRVWRPWGLRRIKIGPSLAKIILDLFVALTTLGCLCRRRYVAIHSHEEAVFIAAGLAGLFQLPHLYDMHSSLPQQLSNWHKWYAAPLTKVATLMERWAIRRSDVLITICPALTEQVKAVAPTKPQVTIENAATFSGAVSAEQVAAVRAQYGVGDAPLIVYTGNFEPYQGVDLLLESFTMLHPLVPNARLLIVGGTERDIAKARQWTETKHMHTTVIFAGTVAPEAVAKYLAAADVLVSPRRSGTNTPLKLYAYLKASKPIVATDLPTHTQVLTPEVAVLTKMDPQAFSHGLLTVLTNPALATRLGQRARLLAEEQFNDASYTSRVAHAYNLLLSEAETCAALAA